MFFRFTGQNRKPIRIPLRRIIPHAVSICASVASAEPVPRPAIRYASGSRLMKIMDAATFTTTQMTLQIMRSV